MPPQDYKIILPDPCLVVLCGPSGSGKSTFARKHFRPTQVVSSDRCRALITDSEAFGPDSSGRAFLLLHETIRHRMALRKLTVADTTALDRSSRAQFLEMARECGVPSVLILFDIRETECIRREEARRRHVGSAVIRRQERLFLTARASAPSEGFAAIYTLDESVESIAEILLESETHIAPPPALPPEKRDHPLPFEGWDDAWALLEREHRNSMQLRQEASGGGEDDFPVRLRAARAALLAAETDPRWMLFRPALPEPSPGEWKIPAELLKEIESARRAQSPAHWSARAAAWLRRALHQSGLRRVCLEAWPAESNPAVLITVREGNHAVRYFGAEGAGALFTGAGIALLNPGDSQTFFDSLARDLNNSAFFSRMGSPILAAQGFAIWPPEHMEAGPRQGGLPEDWLRWAAPPRSSSASGRDRSLRFWLTDILIPPSPGDPAAPDVLWRLTETADLSEYLGAPPRIILEDLARGALMDLAEAASANLSEGAPAAPAAPAAPTAPAAPSARAAGDELAGWLAEWLCRPGWRIVLARGIAERPAAGESAKNAKESLECGIGWRTPPVVLAEGLANAPASGEARHSRLARAPEHSPRPMASKESARKIWKYREESIRAFLSGGAGRPWRNSTAAAWLEAPAPLAGPQEDIFLDSGAGAEASLA